MRGKLFFTGPLAALALLVSSGCGGGTVGSGPQQSPDMTGAWDWSVNYLDGDNADFTMELREVAQNEYAAEVDGDSVGTVFMTGSHFTWIWNRGDGVSRADGSVFGDSGFASGVDGNGYDTFSDGSPRADFTFTADRR